MKQLILVICTLTLLAVSNAGYGQSTIDSTAIYVVEKNDGSEYVGKIMHSDAREVLIVTPDLGEMVIPKHEIKSIRLSSDTEVTKDGKIKQKELFASRYFITANALPSNKGDSYVLFNYWGPDFEFCVKNNLTVGLMTSWVAMPILGTVKYSMPLSDNVHAAVGTILGTGSWVEPSFGIAVPFAALTLGDKNFNINIAAGYGTVFTKSESHGQSLLSFAGYKKVSDKISIVFDSFIMPNIKTTENSYDGFGNLVTTENTNSVMLLVPGIRWQTSRNSAFQMGFSAISANGKFAPVPIPFVQWFRKL